MAEDFTRGLLKTLAVMRPYHFQIVIGGGWAPFLYYRYLAKNREHTPVLTRDIDFMVRHQVPLVGPKTIDEILTKEAKLTTAFKSLDNPPVIHYEGTIYGIEVEILAWSGYCRNCFYVGCVVVGKCGPTYPI